MKPLSQLSLEEVRGLDATELVRASLMDQSAGGVRHGAETLTKRAPAPSGGMTRDMQIIEACSASAGQLVGMVRRELDAEIKSLREELEALRQEIAALRVPQLRAVA